MIHPIAVVVSVAGSGVAWVHAIATTQTEDGVATPTSYSKSDSLTLKKIEEGATNRAVAADGCVGVHMCGP